jgi:hypothetical protein
MSTTAQSTTRPQPEAPKLTPTQARDFFMFVIENENMFTPAEVSAAHRLLKTVEFVIREGK